MCVFTYKSHFNNLTVPCMTCFNSPCFYPPPSQDDHVSSFGGTNEKQQVVKLMKLVKHRDIGKNMYEYIYILYRYICIPRAPMTSIFEGQPLQNKAFSNQNRGHLGSRYTFIGGETSNMCFCTPKLGKMNPCWLIFLTWVFQPPTRYRILSLPHSIVLCRYVISRLCSYMSYHPMVFLEDKDEVSGANKNMTDSM